MLSFEIYKMLDSTVKYLAICTAHVRTEKLNKFNIFAFQQLNRLEYSQ